MNDALLSQRLRELRVPPPASGFEQRLRAALEVEGRALVASLTRDAARKRAARRWTGRAGLALAVTLGASAAAAAAGWMSWAPREDVGESFRALPAAGSESRRRAPSGQQSSQARAEHRVSAPEESSATQPPVVADTPASSPVAPSVPTPERGTERAQRSAPPGSALIAERPSRARHEPPPVKGPSAGAPSIVPFELPGVNFSGPGSPSKGGADHQRSSARRAPRAEPKDIERPLPKLDRASRERGKREASRGKSEAMRERDRTREARGRENAERGLERAREARDRNGK